MRLLNWMLVIVLCTSCAALRPAEPTPPPQPDKRTAVYNEEEYAPYRRSGTGVLTGQVFARQRGGTVVRGAGVTVSLNPVTSYSREWYTAFMFGRALEESDPRINDCNHTTRADADGRFRFEGLAPGRYFVASYVFWEVGYQQQGGRVGAEVQLEEGKTTDVLLDR